MAINKQNNLLVVDIQPAYNYHCRHIVKEVCKLLNKAKNPVVMFVGYGLTEDTQPAVIDYLLEYGLKESALEKITFIEKDYGFFRSWMDTGINQDVIVESIQGMIKENVRDSRDLPEITEIMENDSIYLPDLPEQTFKRKNWALCGGGRDECLNEIEIWLQALNINHETIEELTY